METLLETAKVAAREAGEAVMELYESAEFDTKHDGSPVTKADMVANDIIHTHLEKTGIPVLSEESEGIDLPYPERLWIIDPIDGTKDFIKKTGNFVVMIGLIENGRPILGVMYAPAHKTLYYASKGNGAFAENDDDIMKLYCTPNAQEKVRFVRSINHFTPYMEEVARKLDADFVPRGSMGIKTTLICENIGDFYFSWGKLGEWDMCAPEIIAIEAGGVVTDCYGSLLEYGSSDHRLQKGVICANTGCHERVLEAVSTTPID